MGRKLLASFSKYCTNKLLIGASNSDVKFCELKSVNAKSLDDGNKVGEHVTNFLLY